MGLVVFVVFVVFVVVMLAMGDEAAAENTRESSYVPLSLSRRFFFRAAAGSTFSLLSPTKMLMAPPSLPIPPIPPMPIPPPVTLAKPIPFPSSTISGPCAGTGGRYRSRNRWSFVPLLLVVLRLLPPSCRRRGAKTGETKLVGRASGSVVARVVLAVPPNVDVDVDENEVGTHSITEWFDEQEYDGDEAYAGECADHDDDEEEVAETYAGQPP